MNIINSAAEVIVAADRVGRILCWNLAGEKVSGYTAEEVVGKPITKLMPERYHIRQIEAFQRLQRGGKSKLLSQTIASTALRKHGHEFPVDISLGSWDVGGKTIFHCYYSRYHHQKANGGGPCPAF